MTLQVFHCKSFTKDPQLGNGSGIVLDADTLSDEQMLQVAQKLGYSESAFVQKSDKAEYKIKFFTKKDEMKLCAHATLAAFNALVRTGKLTFDNKDELTINQETSLGVLPVTGYKDGLIVMTQKDPVFFPTELNRQQLADLLTLDESEIVEQSYEIASTGTPKLIIPVTTLDALNRVKPNLEGIKEYSQKSEARGVYAYTTETIDEGSDFHARQFNPLAGINEDPITGVAAGALGAYIKKNKLSDKTKFVIEQGYIMHKGGKIIVDVTDEIKVGGYSLTVKEETIDL